MATTEKTVVIGGQGGSVSHSETLTELLYLIQRFLQVGPCHRSAEVLRQEIEQQALLPVRRDFAGGSHERLFDDYVSVKRRLAVDVGRERTTPPPPDRLFRCTVRPDALLAICHRIRPLLDAALPPSVAGLPPLLIATGRQSLLRTAESIAALRRPFVENAVRFKGAPV
uniref:BRWD/PHIP N-terminal domain-containing protein n=1 Tax=Plectus sambesii TaxID=2011161 RepID=A0A914XA76_9BILA